jgi:hypothetical protein
MVLSDLASELMIHAYDLDGRVQTMPRLGDRPPAGLAFPGVVHPRPGGGPCLKQHAEGLARKIGTSLQESIEAQQPSAVGVVPIPEGLHPGHMRPQHLTEKAAKRREGT